MEWYKSESATRPEEIDTTSSRKYNYVRKNITEEQRPSEDGETITVFVYDECKIPKEAWGLYLELAATQEAVDYLIMEG